MLMAIASILQFLKDTRFMVFDSSSHTLLSEYYHVYCGKIVVQKKKIRNSAQKFNMDNSLYFVDFFRCSRVVLKLFNAVCIVYV